MPIIIETQEARLIAATIGVRAGLIINRMGRKNTVELDANIVIR